MEKIDDLKSPQILEAVLVWTGWGRHPSPRRNDSSVVDHFGAEAAASLLPTIKLLEEDFYSSDARFVATNIQEMERISAEQFREKHSDISDKIVKAFAWCYTFDFK